MKKYEIDLDDFCEDIFHEMEKIQYGSKGHKVVFAAEAEDMKLDVAQRICFKLVTFVASKMKEI